MRRGARVGAVVLAQPRRAAPRRARASRCTRGTWPRRRTGPRGLGLGIVSAELGDAALRLDRRRAARVARAAHRVRLAPGTVPARVQHPSVDEVQPRRVPACTLALGRPPPHPRRTPQRARSAALAAAPRGRGPCRHAARRGEQHRVAVERAGSSVLSSSASRGAGAPSALASHARSRCTCARTAVR